MIGKTYREYFDSMCDKESVNYKWHESKRKFLDEILAQKEEEMISEEVEKEIYKQIEEQIVDLLKKELKL